MFIFCFILFEIVLALSKKKEICFLFFIFISNTLAYIKEKELPAFFFFKERHL